MRWPDRASVRSGTVQISAIDSTGDQPRRGSGRTGSWSDVRGVRVPGIGLLDRLAERLLAESPYRFALAETEVDRSTAYRIRATASVEAGWALPDAFPDGMERDAFDSVAVHVLGWDGGVAICTGRLVFPPGSLPTEVACGLVVEPHGQVVDVGRMSVLRSHQTFGHGAFLVLLCRLYREARAAGYEFACGMMASPARSLVDRLGLRLEQLGPERMHHGQLRAPVRFVLTSNAGPLLDRWGPDDQAGGPSTREVLTPPKPKELDSP